MTFLRHPGDELEMRKVYEKLGSCVQNEDAVLKINEPCSK